MSFVVRSAARGDVSHLYDLARQFTLLNLPADEGVIAAKIDRSRASFRGELAKADAEYLFVTEDTATGRLVGSSLILAKSGTPAHPNFIFRILKKEHYSAELGVGFIHQLLRLVANTDGPTEVGGLVVDRAYRGRPEKVGRLISLMRFVYIGLHPERFEDDLHSEMTLAEDGKSEFWDALGGRFTGMSYPEADRLSARSNGFIPNLFPSEDIYLALLDTPARLVLGKVGKETEAALELLNRVGFAYKDEVDPFDGGPHVGCRTKDCTVIKTANRVKVARGAVNTPREGLLGLDRAAGFTGAATAFELDGDVVRVPESTWRLLDLDENEAAIVTPL